MANLGHVDGGATTGLAAPGTDPGLPAGTRTLRDLEFARPRGRPLHLDLFVPPGEQLVPLVLWIHGGGWMQFSKTDGVQALGLLSHGYAVASTDYRLSSEAIFPAQIHDVKAAVRYLRANAAGFGLDPERFGVWGESAGGHLAALLGTTSVCCELEGEEGVTGVSSRVQAVVDLYGPTDLLQRKAQTPEGAQDPEAPDSSSARLLGGPPSRRPERARQANPIIYVTKGAPPFLVVHGDADDLVPLGQSELLVAALRATGAEVDFMLIKGGGHGGEAFQDTAILAAIRAFLDRHMKGGNRA